MMALAKGGDKAMQLLEDIVDIYPPAKAKWAFRKGDSLPGGRQQMIDILRQICDDGDISQPLHYLCIIEPDEMEWKRRAFQLGNVRPSLAYFNQLWKTVSLNQSLSVIGRAGLLDWAVENGELLISRFAPRIVTPEIVELDTKARWTRACIIEDWAQIGLLASLNSDEGFVENELQWRVNRTEVYRRAALFFIWAVHELGRDIARVISKIAFEARKEAD